MLQFNEKSSPQFIVNFTAARAKFSTKREWCGDVITIEGVTERVNYLDGHKSYYRVALVISFSIGNTLFSKFNK